MSEMAPTAHGVLEYLIKSLVNQPEEVHIETSGEERCVFSVTVAEEDMGRVIGRTVVRAAAINDEIEIDVDFVD